MLELVEKLYAGESLSDDELAALMICRDDDVSEKLTQLADKVRRKYYGDKIFLRGLIEISSYCRNDCLYCGIRRSNKAAQRYRLTPDEILQCAENGYALGFRTFVMQGGEDAFFSDDVMCGIISRLRAGFPDCAITLSLGERSRESYQRMKDAGADRYLLRHEAASETLYRKLHPSEMSLDNRKKCLSDLRELGYQTGAGFMVGAPFQTVNDIVADIRFMEQLRPHMIGIGPFIPQHDTPFGGEKGGTLRLTLRVLGILRLMFPKVLLPATTALGTISPDGRKLGLKAGCNVIMPNLSPADVREKYKLYDNKLISGGEAAEGLALLKKEILEAGYSVSDERGDCVFS